MGTRSGRPSVVRPRRASLRTVTIAVAFAVAVVTVARRLAPKLHARLLARCERMFEQLPDEFPPKRMLRGIEEARANSARAVELLEERSRERETTGPGDVASRREVVHAG